MFGLDSGGAKQGGRGGGHLRDINGAAYLLEEFLFWLAEVLCTMRLLQSFSPEFKLSAFLHTEACGKACDVAEDDGFGFSK